MINYFHSPMSYVVNWNIKQEPVYRLLDNVEWMENFFQYGELRLSSFKKFRTYPNEVQGDKNEGEAIVGGDDELGNLNLVVYESGLNSFVMSATKITAPGIIKAFNSKCAIKINNPTLFALEVAKKIPFVRSGLEGSCDYKDYRSHLFEIKESRNTIFQKLDFKNNIEESKERFIELTMGQELFLKLDSYSYQQEYRLIWFSESQIPETITIQCPEARAYCEAVKF
jgi:hypothetical protein